MNFQHAHVQTRRVRLLQAMTAEMGANKWPVPIFIIQSEADPVVNVHYAENIRDSWGKAFGVDTQQSHFFSRVRCHQRHTLDAHEIRKGPDGNTVVETCSLTAGRRPEARLVRRRRRAKLPFPMHRIRPSSHGSFSKPIPSTPAPVPFSHPRSDRHDGHPQQRESQHSSGGHGGRRRSRRGDRPKRAKPSFTLTVVI